MIIVGSSRGSATRASGTCRSTTSPTRLEHLRLTGVRVTASLPRWADFGCSDPYLERFHQVMVRTLDNNLIHIPTDTPTYEKNGWTGDAQTALPAILTNYDAERFLTKWLNDLRDAQRPDGWLPVIAPTPDWGFEGWPSPEWTTVYPHLLSELVAEYGATALIDDHLEPVLASLRWELSRRDDDGLVDSVCGDYLSPGTPGPPPEDRRFTGSLFLARALYDAARLCQLTATDRRLPRRPRASWRRPPTAWSLRSTASSGTSRLAATGPVPASTGRPRTCCRWGWGSSPRSEWTASSLPWWPTSRPATGTTTSATSARAT